MHSADQVETTPMAVPFLGGFRVSWPLLIGVTGLLLPALMGWGLMDPDTYWHIAAGRWMLAHGAVLTHDPFSFTRHGAAWVAHEWGAELLIAWTYGIAGWAGLVFLAAACFAATLAYLLRFLLSRMEPLHALVLAYLAANMMFPSLLARPHALVWPLTALWVGVLVNASESRRSPPWWLLGVMLLWANMHGSYILGLGMAVMLALDSVIEARTERWDVAKRWLAFIAASFACVLVNPQGYRLLLFPFRLLGMSSLDYIAEWRQPNLQHLQILSLWLVVILGLAFIGRIRLSLMRNLLLLGLLFMALQHVRNVALLGLLTPFILARPVAALWRRLPSAERNPSALDRGLANLSHRAAPMTVCVALVAAALTAGFALHLRRPHPPEYAAPQAALDAILARGAGQRILNDYGFGGYLIFRGVPVFMDGRADLYGDAFLRRAVEALSLAPGGHLGALLRTYRFSAILLRPSWPAVQLLNHMPGWKRVYVDEGAVAYVRREEGTT